MILGHQGLHPKIHATARIAPNAVICGNVTIGPDVSVGFGAVITAESGAVEIGEACVIMDTAVIRGLARNPVRIGDHVLVGPRAYLTGCEIGDDVFIATGAAVFNGARIGARAEVRINGVVHLRTLLPPGAVVPIGWVAVGDPAEMFSPDRHEEIWAVQRPLDFPRYVFGIERPPEGETAMPDVMTRYARALGRWHAEDVESTR